jgi:inorganic triphosphatase YgiF
LRATNVHSGITQFLRLAEQAGDRALSELLKRLARAEQLFARNRRKTMRAWIDALQRSLTEIGVYAGLAADAAGIELLELLDALRADLDTDALRLEFGEWRQRAYGRSTRRSY